MRSKWHLFKTTYEMRGVSAALSIEIGGIRFSGLGPWRQARDGRYGITPAVVSRLKLPQTLVYETV